MYEDPDYGTIIALPIDDELSGYQDDIILKFTSRGGLMVTGNYQIYYVNYGGDAVYKTSMKHNDDDLIGE